MEFLNSFKSTRSGFSHTSKLYLNGELLSEAKAHYLNRTWESYAYQSVMKQAVRNAIENEIAEEKSKRLTKTLREQIETESELIQQLKEKLNTL